MAKIHYVYLTTNLINGKQYVGDHTINPKELYYYIGSGSYFYKANKKYGYNNFIKEILEWFDTREEAFESQEKYIKHYNTLVPNGYNISPKGGHQVSGGMSQATKDKISLKRKGIKLNLTDEQRLRRSEVQKGKKQSEEVKRNRALKQTGKKMSEESKEKNRLSHLGKKASEETRKKLSASHIGKSSWNKGIPTSVETKKKQSQSLKGKNKGKRMSEDFKLKIKKSWEKRKALKCLQSSSST
jgi:group I intron endonuclease